MRIPNASGGRFIASCGVLMLVLATIGIINDVAADRSILNVFILAIAGLLLTGAGYFAKR